MSLSWMLHGVVISIRKGNKQREEKRPVRNSGTTSWKKRINKLRGFLEKHQDRE